MARIFLCHASEDKSQVRAIYKRLQEEGFQPWLDEEDLLPGNLWEQEIPKIIKTSEFILIFFSNNSVKKRGYIQREFKLALDAWQEIPEGVIHTIPVLLDVCDIPDQFKRYQHVNIFHKDGFGKMINAIRVELSRSQSSQGTDMPDIPHQPESHFTNMVNMEFICTRSQGLNRGHASSSDGRSP